MNPGVFALHDSLPALRHSAALNNWAQSLKTGACQTFDVLLLTRGAEFGEILIAPIAAAAHPPKRRAFRCLCRHLICGETVTTLRQRLSFGYRPARPSQSASSLVSPVRIRVAPEIGVTKILPSPIWPVRADVVITSTT